MITTERAKELMWASIDEARKSQIEDQGVHPYVGAVLAGDDGQIIAAAHRGETGDGRHAEFILLSKASEKGLDLSRTELFVTLEPCTARGPGKTPCAERIKQSGVRRVHIGMLDPNPQILGRGETALRWAGLEVERFPHELVSELEALNAAFVKLHKEAHIPTDSLYVRTQVSDIILQELQREGLEIKELPYDWDVSIEDLVQYCVSAYPSQAQWDLGDLIHRIRGQAFDKKYADYTYDSDVRGIVSAWKDDLAEVIKGMVAGSLCDRRVLYVGIGNGIEGVGLLEDMQSLTIVDIASRSLNLAHSRFPRAKAIVASAENLKPIRSGSQDLYVSLRTFQSSYFDITSAVREAYRVLRPGGVFIVSVANAFVGAENAIIPGLVVPHTAIVDRNRPFEVADRIRRHLALLRFNDIGIRSSISEVFVYGRRSV
jgi:pyrimidine deaminase RibD-like protein/SAM-dependent methyltransferase